MRSLINYINYDKNIGEHYENKKCHKSAAYKNVRAQLNRILNLVTKTVRKKQIVFALLYPSFQQVWNPLVTCLTGISDLLQGCPNNSDTDLL